MNTRQAAGGRRYRMACGLRSLVVATFWLSLISGGGAIAQETIALQGAAIETMGPQGRLEQATIIIEDGRIVAVGVDIPIPARARLIDASGKTILPGFVDPYFVVDFPMGAEPVEEARTIVVRGRRRGFQVPRASGTTASFVRIADVFDPKRGDWDTALRSGITTAQVVSRGYGQSVVANPMTSAALQNALAAVSTSSAASGHPMIVDANGSLFTAVSNDTSSLRTIRDGLSEPRGSGGEGSRRGFRGRSGGDESGRAPQGDGSRGSAGGAASGSAPAQSSAAQDLWKVARGGERSVFVNTNNAAAILYVLAEFEKVPAARLVAIANGADWYLTLDALKAPNLTAVLPARLDTEPSNQNRVNVPRLMHERGLTFAFSLSIGQSDYRSTQQNPLFPVAMLVKSGLPRQVALEALTTRPAQLLGIADQVGSIEVGKRADLVVMDDDPMSATAEVVQVWIAGALAYGE